MALCLPPANVGEGRAPKPGLAGPCLASRSPSTAPPASPPSSLQPVTDRAEQMAPNIPAGSGLISVLVTGQGTSINRGLRWPLCNPGIPSLQMRKLRPQSSVSNPVIRRLGFQTRLLLLTGFLWGSSWVPGGKSGDKGPGRFWIPCPKPGSGAPLSRGWAGSPGCGEGPSGAAPSARWGVGGSQTKVREGPQRGQVVAPPFDPQDAY